MKFIVSKEFFEKVDNAVFGVIIARGINNHEKYEFIDELLKTSIKNCQKYYEGKVIKESVPITYYRDAFRKLDINPNKYMCSIEALVTRTAKKGEMPNINTLVDLGNALSLKYNIPLGIHDIDKFSGDIEIREAKGTEDFIPFGGEGVEHPDKGEIIYVSGNDVKTRRWTWRQGENSKITENTTNIFIPLDAFIENKEDMLKLQEEFVEILKNKLNADVKIGLVDKSNNEYEF